MTILRTFKGWDGWYILVWVDGTEQDTGRMNWDDMGLNGSWLFFPPFFRESHCCSSFRYWVLVLSGVNKCWIEQLGIIAYLVVVSL